jgi:calcineurin-like phosphoesterase family protein
MAETFLIADTHFGHKKIAAIRGFASVEEHDETLVDRWNSVVRKQDTVWVLGDVLFYKGSFPILARLKGTKKMVSGNHDEYRTVDYLKYFNRVQGAIELAGCILTHIPINENQFPRYRGNIHGHLHHRRVGREGVRWSEKWPPTFIPDQRYQCVSAEQNDLTPIPLHVVLERMPPHG